MFDLVMGWITLGAFAILGLSMAVMRVGAYFDKDPERELPPYMFVGMSGVWLALPVIMVLGAMGLLEVAYLHAEEVVDSAWLAPALIGSASGLFYLKKKPLLLYGAIEVTAALGVIAFVSYADQGSTGARLAAAATAAYFLIRGLDNVSLSSQGGRLLKKRGWLQAPR